MRESAEQNVGSGQVTLSVQDFLRLTGALERIAENGDICHGYGYTGCVCSSVASEALATDQGDSSAVAD
jgi:hypothetical protein